MNDNFMMPHMSRCLAIALLLLSPLALRAQKQNNKWYFGYNAAIDFNGGAPVSISGSSLGSLEGSASVADHNTGALLFYTDGAHVWNRNNAPMPSNQPLKGDESSSQSALIVPVPDDSMRYYIFTTSSKDAGFTEGLQYTIVDMRLNGGLGDVAQPSTLLVKPVVEKVTAVFLCNRHEFWVLAHGWQNNSFYAYPVTSAGVGTPVVSNVGLVHTGPSEDNSVGYMKASPNGRKVAVAIRDMQTVQLFDFDAATGMFSNPITLKSPISGCQTYGLSFSPDNRNLYVAEYYGGIFQYDVTSHDSSRIAASRYTVWTKASQENPGALQLGPDGKIYCALYPRKVLGVISSPNAPGAACDFTHDGVSLTSGSSAIGLPNMIDSHSGTTGSTTDTVRAYIARDLYISPAQFLIVPVLVDNPAAISDVNEVSLRIGYTPDMVSVHRVIATDAWNIMETTDSSGELHLRLKRSAGAPTYPGDTLVLVEFAGHASEIISSELPVAFDFGAMDCITPGASPGLIRVRASGVSDRDGASGNDGYSIRVVDGSGAFSPGTIGFSIGHGAPTRLQIFDASGRLVATLLDKDLAAGRYSATWDASGMPSGTYFCRLTSGGWSGSERVIVAR